MVRGGPRLPAEADPGLRHRPRENPADAQRGGTRALCAARGIASSAGTRADLQQLLHARQTKPVLVAIWGQDQGGTIVRFDSR